MKEEKDIAPMDFAECLRKSVVSEQVLKDIAILAKADEIYNILKSLLATGDWSRHEDGTFK